MAWPIIPVLVERYVHLRRPSQGLGLRTGEVKTKQGQPNRHRSCGIAVAL